MGKEAIRLNDNETGAVLIAGPTASGKSALAMTLAGEGRCVVINADSMQVYRDLEILTARPSDAEMASIPHRLYGHLDASRNYSVGDWLEDVAAELSAAREAGRRPLVVGGTGLYFKALTEGLSAIPAIPDDLRAHWRTRAEGEPAETLHGELRRRDPAMADKIPPSDRQRIVRALEVFEATGRSLTQWQAQKPPPLVDPARVRRIVLAPPRDILHQRAAERFKQMIAAGALDEVARLVARRLDPQLPAMKAIGVRPLTAHLAGDCGLDAAIERSIVETRRYIKRQTTWLRGQMADWEWLEA